MTLIQGYLFRQIARPVVGACAALAGIGILSQSLDQLEVIVERGQSVWVMVKLTLLAVPQLLAVIIPIGLFVGALGGVLRVVVLRAVIGPGYAVRALHRRFLAGWRVVGDDDLEFTVRVGVTAGRNDGIVPRRKVILPFEIAQCWCLWSWPDDAVRLGR